MQSQSLSYDSANSIGTQTEQTFDDLTLDSLAVAITFSQTIRSFAKTAPSKLKWCDLTNSDMKRLTYYDILRPADVNMEQNTVWTLKEWVTVLFDTFEQTFNFSSKQIHLLSNNADLFLNIHGTFSSSDVSVGSRKLGQFRENDLLEFADDNRGNHKTTMWRRTEKLDRLCSIYNAL